MTRENWEKQQILYYEHQMYACIADLKGMEFTNKQREIEQKSMAYVDTDFNTVRDELLALSFSLQNIQL